MQKFAQNHCFSFRWILMNFCRIFAKSSLNCRNQAKIDVIDLLNVPNDYEVIFLQGGATLQFSMIPLNFSYLGKVANFAEIGSWSSKAIKEASNICKVNICTSSKDNNFTKIENFDEYNDLPEIISYDHKSIDVFYKQPGYLQLNKRKLINSIFLFELFLS